MQRSLKSKRNNNLKNSTKPKWFQTLKPRLELIGMPVLKVFTPSLEGVLNITRSSPLSIASSPTKLPKEKKLMTVKII